MPTVAEAVNRNPGTPLSDALGEGVNAIGYDQIINFEPYVRLILPLDGYAFWVKKKALKNSSMFNLTGFNSAELNEDLPEADIGIFQAQGSLHYSTDEFQQEETSGGRDRVVFTSLQPVQNLSAIDPQILYIGRFDGPVPGEVPPADSTEIRFAFSSRSSHYQQAGLWHYTGVAVNPTMMSQVVDDPAKLLSYPLIVSNSLPAWLALSYYDPPWPVPVKIPGIKFYPSFLVPQNLEPPYVTVHIDPAATEGWQSMPYLNSMTDQYQLARDRVQLTLYGCNNDMAQSILYAIMQYSLDTEVFGILNIPAVRDEKETQVELHTLAQKKRIAFDVSYNQSDVRNMARQLIESCVPTVQVGDEVISQP